MSAPASPPLSVWEQPGLDAGAKLAWLGLRSFATFGDDGEVFVWPSRAGLARRIGAKPEAVKKQVARLTKLGLVTRASRRIDGADRDGWVVQAGEHRARGEAVPRGAQGLALGTTLPAPGEAVPQARVPQAPYTLQDQSNYQSSEGEAPATPQPSVNGAPVGETPGTATVMATAEHPGRGQVAQAHGQGSIDGDGDGDGARAANEHLGSELEAHRARIESHPPAPSRVELTPAVHAAVVAARMSSQLAGPRWSEWMLEALDDLGVPEREHAETVARVLGVWTSTGPSADKPAKSQIWGWRWRPWLREAMGLAESTKPKGKFDGALGPKRRAKDFDGHGEVCDAAKVSWV